MKNLLIPLMAITCILLGASCAHEHDIVVPARTTTTVEQTRVTRPVEPTNTITTVERTHSVQY